MCGFLVFSFVSVCAMAFGKELETLTSGILPLPSLPSKDLQRRKQILKAPSSSSFQEHQILSDNGSGDDEEVALLSDKVDLRSEKEVTQGSSCSKKIDFVEAVPLPSLVSTSSEVAGDHVASEESLYDSFKSYGRTWKRIPRKKANLVSGMIPHDKDSSENLTVGCS
ncbi:unnamed protein product [Amaranthus hypochondriacus]